MSEQEFTIECCHVCERPKARWDGQLNNYLMCENKECPAFNEPMASASFRRMVPKDQLAKRDAEIERLRAENERLRDGLHTCHAGCTKAGCVNARLREALEQIKDDANDFGEAYRIARAALEGK